MRKLLLGAVAILAMSSIAHAGGWYLIDPPSMEETHCHGLTDLIERFQQGTRQHLQNCQREYSAKDDVEAPIYKWQVFRSYETLADCQKERADLVKRFKRVTVGEVKDDEILIALEGGGSANETGTVDRWIEFERTERVWRDVSGGPRRRNQ